jgi:uncharacterized protein YbcV (DUF1398 family)
MIVMTMTWKEVARAALDAAEADAIPFPESVRMLMEAGFDGYAIDFRHATRTYYRPDGETLTLDIMPTAPVAPRFDAAIVRGAIREAQMQVPGYTYKGFCAKAAGAGCMGYLVSFLGQRVLYYGRTGETHTEYFPGTRPAS